MTNHVYICPNHPGLGEVFVGQTSAEQIKADGCLLCETEQLRAIIRIVQHAIIPFPYVHRLEPAERRAKNPVDQCLCFGGYGNMVIATDDSACIRIPCGGRSRRAGTCEVGE